MGAPHFLHNEEVLQLANRWFLVRVEDFLQVLDTAAEGFQLVSDFAQTNLQGQEVISHHR